MYNDVDMVWLADPFPHLQGKHDVYFTDDMAAVSVLKSDVVSHSNKLLGFGQNHGNCTSFVNINGFGKNLLKNAW